MASPIPHLISTVTDDFTHSTSGADLYDGKPIWITEFNVKHFDNNEQLYTEDGIEIYNPNGFHGSWVDMMSKLNLIDQYFALSSEFNAALPGGAVNELYNEESDGGRAVPELDIEFMMFHTYYANDQTSVIVDSDDESIPSVQFNDQGLASIIIDRLTTDGFSYAEPLTFLNDASGIYSSRTLAHADADMACPKSEDYHFSNPDIWGWKVYDDPTDLCRYRMLVVNTSNTCREVQNFNQFDHMNTDLFIYESVDLSDANGDPNPDGIPEFIDLDMNSTKVQFIQDASNSGPHLDETGFCFYTGAFPEEFESISGNGIIVPAQCIMLLSGVADEPLALNEPVIQVNTCSNENNGSLEIAPQGGIPVAYIGDSPVYNIAWTGPNGFTASTESISGLDAGSYEVTVTDATGCQVSASYEVLTTTFSITEESITGSCPDVGTGAIDVSVTASNATGTLTYLWDDPGTSTTEDLIEVLNGTYSLMVSDDRCTSDPISVIIPELLYQSSYDASALDDICASSELIDITDLISLQMAAGEFISFSGPGVIGEDFDPAGLEDQTVTISLQISDDDCTWPAESFDIVVIDCCTELSLSSFMIPACPGLPDGSLDVTPTGGAEPYTYSWSGPDEFNSTSQNISGIGGSYSVQVSDANGCTVTQDVEIDFNLPVTMEEFYNYEVHVEDEWNIDEGEYGFLYDLVIEDGGEVDISPGAILQFAPDAGIVVESGGMLLLNGSTVTRFDCSDDFWKGIDVQAADPEPSLSNGTILTWESMIEYALIGINNYDRTAGPANTAGGNIACWTTEFTDCQTAVRLRRRNGTSSYSSLASFKECDFKWTNNLPSVNLFFSQPLIDLKESTVHLTLCDFYNENDQLLSQTINHAHNPAIYSYRTRLSVTGDDASSVRNEMSGFRHGIVQHGGRAYVEQMDFHNFRSAYVVSSKGSRFTSNNFGILPEDRLDQVQFDNNDFSYKTMYGLYLESSTAFWVEDNEFFLAWPDEQDPYGSPPDIPEFPYTAGLFVRGSGPAQNQIYRNRFYYNDNASIAYDDNRNEDTEDASGLKYTCNEFYYNDNGVNVVSTVNDYNPGWGIHASQGVAPQFGEQGISAGNYFEGQTINDLRLDGNLPTFSYYWHPTDANFSLQTDGDINEVNQGIGQYNNGQGCPSRLTQTRSSRSASADLDKQAAEQFRQQYVLLVDGGDTEGLLSEVVLTQYGEALELYYELMSKSPHLSEEVMIEAIQKETELPAALLTLILESNPQAAKSKEVEEKLDERMMPLEEYQRYMIDQGKNLLSDKEKLEARIAYHESEQHAALDEIIVEIMMDSTIVDKRAEIDAEVDGRESLDIRYLRIDLALEDGDVTTAQTLLDKIPTDIPLRGLKDQEYLDFVTCYELLIEVLMTESTTLSQAQEDDLYLIADKHSTRASGLAQILLTEYTDYTFDEVLVDPEATAKSRRNWDPRKPKFSTDPSLSVYPNPASELVVLEFRNWSDQVTLELRDAAGRLVRSEQINSSKTAYVLDVSELSEGSYTMLLRSLDGILTEKRQIEVVR